MVVMNRAHLIVGCLFLLIFLATGVYMLFGFPELFSGREEVRMMYRATHIYILMASLVNLMAANCNQHASSRPLLLFRVFASGLVLISPLLMTVAFWFEPPAYLIDRPISFWGVLTLLLGVLTHSAINVWQSVQGRKSCVKS